MTNSKSPPIGEQLKHWRRRRDISQMELALQSDSSARHLSFIETGRAHPSRELLLKLCEVLEIPMRSRNTLLIAAGYAPLYRETGLSEPEMEEVRDILKLILENSDPYPAMLIDRCMNVVMANRSWQYLLSEFVADHSLLQQTPLNLIRLMSLPGGFRKYIVNYHSAYHTLLERARRSLIADAPGDQLLELIDEMEKYKPPEEKASALTEPEHLPQLVMPLHFKKGELELQLLTTTATLGEPLNITLQELRIESGYPLDKASDQYLKKFFQAHRE